jgi:hypothetical protein
MSDDEAPWSRGLFASPPVSVPDEATGLYAETIRQRQEIERLEAEVAELAEENAVIRKLANKYLAESTVIKEECARLCEECPLHDEDGVDWNTDPRVTLAAAIRAME